MVVEPLLQVSTWQRRPSSHTQTWFWHLVFAGQVPLQVIEPPQPSPMSPPQYWTAPVLVLVHESLVQVASPLQVWVVASQVLPAPQLVEQASEPPQPSPMVPQ
jgi:hypothetical protein